jgi:hypothetical protein
VRHCKIPSVQRPCYSSILSYQPKLVGAHHGGPTADAQEKVIQSGRGPADEAVLHLQPPISKQRPCGEARYKSGQQSRDRTSTNQLRTHALSHQVNSILYLHLHRRKRLHPLTTSRESTLPSLSCWTSTLMTPGENKLELSPGSVRQGGAAGSPQAARRHGWPV